MTTQSEAQHFADMVNNVYGSSVTLHWTINAILAAAGSSLTQHYVEFNTLIFKDGSACTYTFTVEGVEIHLIPNVEMPTHSIDETYLHEDYENEIYSLNVLNDQWQIQPQLNMGHTDTLGEALAEMHRKGVKVLKIDTTGFAGIVKFLV